MVWWKKTGLRIARVYPFSKVKRYWSSLRSNIVFLSFPIRFRRPFTIVPISMFWISLKFILNFLPPCQFLLFEKINWIDRFWKIKEPPHRMASAMRLPLPDQLSLSLLYSDDWVTRRTAWKSLCCKPRSTRAFGCPCCKCCICFIHAVHHDRFLVSNWFYLQYTPKNQPNQ